MIHKSQYMKGAALDRKELLRLKGIVAFSIKYKNILYLLNCFSYKNMFHLSKMKDKLILNIFQMCENIIQIK